MLPDGYMERQYPIGALPQRDVADIRLDAFCSDPVDIDALMAEWKAKSEVFRSTPRETLDAVDSELVRLNASTQTLAKIEGLLTAYRAYLPTTYELAYVPISKLITPQTYVELEHARQSFQGLSRKLTDDEVAQYCLGAPVQGGKIDATFLGYPKGDPGETNYLYQFSSEDDNMRFIPPMPLKPLHDLDLSAETSSARYDVKAIPVLVGPGLPFIQVLKVPLRMDREGGARLQADNIERRAPHLQARRAWEHPRRRYRPDGEHARGAGPFRRGSTGHALRTERPQGDRHR
jgi:hypothetical protein